VVEIVFVGTGGHKLHTALSRGVHHQLTLLWQINGMVTLSA
jgi:hypothetical protein